MAEDIRNPNDYLYEVLRSPRVRNVIVLNMHYLRDKIAERYARQRDYNGKPWAKVKKVTIEMFNRSKRRTGRRIFIPAGRFQPLGPVATSYPGTHPRVWDETTKRYGVHRHKGVAGQATGALLKAIRASAFVNLKWSLDASKGLPTVRVTFGNNLVGDLATKALMMQIKYKATIYGHPTGNTVPARKFMGFAKKDHAFVNKRLVKVFNKELHLRIDKRLTKEFGLENPSYTRISYDLNIAI